MNRIYRKLALVVLMFSVIFLAACSGDKAPSIEITLENPLRTTIEIDFIVTDEDEQLVNLVAEIYEKGEKTYLSRKTISLSDDGTTDSTVKFADLEVESTYDVIFTGTVNKKAVQLKKLTLETSKNGSEEVPNLITNFEQFKNVKNDADGYHILQNDIDCEGKELPVFFTSSKQFVGDFNGKNFTVKNFKQTGYDPHAGIFGYIGEGGSVYDFKAEDFKIESDRYTEVWMGGFAGFNLGTIKNVHLSNFSLTTLGSSNGAQNIGSFVAVNKNAGLIENCTVKNVKIDSNIPAGLRAGGFVGANQSDNGVSAPLIKDCSATNVLLDLMIDAEPDFSVNDSDQNIELFIGGFIGENKGDVINSTSTVKIYAYVQNTATDKLVNPEDFEKPETGSAKKELKEYTPHKKIDTIKANVGGFVGASTAGSITKCGANASVVLEISYLDQLNAGGFVGRNESTSYIKESLIISSGFKLTFNEKTAISSTVNEVTTSLLGNFVGLSNTNVMDVYSLSNVPFTLRFRKADLTFIDYTASDNLAKLNKLFDENISTEAELLTKGFTQSFIDLIKTPYTA